MRLPDEQDKLIYRETEHLRMPSDVRHGKYLCEEQNPNSIEDVKKGDRFGFKSPELQDCYVHIIKLGCQFPVCENFGPLQTREAVMFGIFGPDGHSAFGHSFVTPFERLKKYLNEATDINDISMVAVERVKVPSAPRSEVRKSIEEIL